MERTVRMPWLVQDREYLRVDPGRGKFGDELVRPVDWIEVCGEAFFDGPVTPRVAVLDFDAEGGGLRPGVRFLPQELGRVSRYDVMPDIEAPHDALMRDLESDAFIQVSTFATVMKTIQFFESPDALGRRVTWAFDSPQLLVLPRAGLLANAFYERESGSLQFFHFPGTAGQTVYTALSHDIIVHEVAHAILDGVVPDLYHATRTQSLALHEAVADLAAVFSGLLNDMTVWSRTHFGSEEDILSDLARVAEEFGTEMRRDTGMDCLRGLYNRRTLDPDSTDLADPYEVSEVMSGAIYQVFAEYARGSGSSDLVLGDAAETAIRRVRGRVARMVFRALDYLPPGEASLADLGRAMIAATEAVYAPRRTERRLLARELVKRKVVKDEAELEADRDVVGRELKEANLQNLLDSDSAARRFAERHRGLLRIPRRSDFEVQPRRVRVRVHRGYRKRRPKQDLVFRVTWEAEEEHDTGIGLASRWIHSVGTTLVLDWDTRRVLSVLTTDQGETAYADRERTLSRWMKTGLMRTPEDAIGPDGQPRTDTIIARRAGKAMRVTGSVRILCT